MSSVMSVHAFLVRGVQISEWDDWFKKSKHCPYLNENAWALTRPPVTYPCQYSCPIDLLSQTFHTLQQLIMTDRQRPVNYANENDDLKPSSFPKDVPKKVMMSRHATSRHIMSHLTSHHNLTCRMKWQSVGITPKSGFFVQTCQNIMVSRRNVTPCHAVTSRVT